MDVTSIAAAISSGKALKNIIQGLVGLKVDTEVLYRINEAQGQVSNLLSALLETQGDLLKLVEENQELRRQIQAQEDWEKRKAGYQIQKTEGGAFVYTSVSVSPAHYVCPRCIEKREIQILQRDVENESGLFGCPGCNKVYAAKPEKDSPIQVKTKFAPRDFHNLSENGVRVLVSIKEAPRAWLGMLASKRK